MQERNTPTSPGIARGRATTLSLIGVMLAAAVLSGCSSDERDPKQPLNADEGAELLREVRDDPDRLQSLTPAERQYLMRTLKK